ncbi:MAG TPA: hypothetical protein DHV36_12415 [Desulfobacteraceae bacterium]|nr:hypothetical protein [Desulfobacteraceae bacterium]
MLSAGQTPAKPKRKHKFNAQKACVDGIKFDSRKEAARYQELKLQQHCGLISGLKLQPEFVLLDAFTSHGKKIRAIKYRADFQYEKEGETVVEDVKGHKTKEYLLKRKMFLRRYPEYRFLES